MGLCRGNVGNLMQHWALVEALVELQRLRGNGDHLLFVTSHSMAPWAVPRQLKAGQDGLRPPFDRARQTLDSRNTRYDRAWRELTATRGLPYPSSALFARETWTGPLSLIACEVDGHVADEIAGWQALIEVQETHEALELHRGDWRDRFSRGLNVQGATALFVEMDPMRFEHHTATSRGDRAVLFLEDLPIVVGAVTSRDLPTVVQISSYTANGDNPHTATEPAICAPMLAAGFHLSGRLVPNGHMISLIFSRGVRLWEGASVEGQFNAWLAGV